MIDDVIAAGFIVAALVGAVACALMHIETDRHRWLVLTGLAAGLAITLALELADVVTGVWAVRLARTITVVLGVVISGVTICEARRLRNIRRSFSAGTP